MNEPKLDVFISYFKKENFKTEEVALDQTFVTNLMYYIQKNNVAAVCEHIKKFYKTDDDKRIFTNLLKLFLFSSFINLSKNNPAVLAPP